VTKLLIFLILVILDLISKMLVVNFIDLYSFIQILFFIDITHIHNYGVSFGLLSGVVHPSILIIIGLLVVFFIYYLMIGSTDYLEEFGLLIILSGAISNIIDRIYNGYVVDFIYIHYKDFYWPAFNFADIYITIGIMMILINILIKIKKPS
tara:strand:- start:1261 stop:1713 length:453 start_codon:yes stop_codon:yes gene_type:complete